MSNSCDHGHLRRVCEICERDDEIKQLKAERDAAVKWLRFCLDECDAMLEWQFGTDAAGEMKAFLGAIDAAKGEK